MEPKLPVKKGERWVYTGDHSPWRGHAGVIDRIENPFKGERDEYEIARVWWDDPPDKRISFAYLTPYNIKQWSRE